jgi:hypothetical protein
MWQMIKKSLWVLLLASGLQSSWAYSLAGPVGNGGDAWQSPVIGYGPPTSLVAPKNLGEEFRRNIPTSYYAFDANFLDYFGSNGVSAVVSALTILDSLTNVDSYSTALLEFSLDTRHINYTAQTLGLYDLKSFTLGAMIEQMGLADPVEWTWTLHDRYLPPGGSCPAGDEEYLVVQRNYDFVSSPLNQLQYSPYVNDTLYSYEILEACTGPNPLALAVPFSVDPLADIYSPVASFAIGWGDYYTGLTRDDVAGLRYLLSTNNVNFETTAAGSLLENPGQTNLIQNFDLGAFLAAALTNDAATVAALFPNVTTAGSSNYFTTVCTPNIVSHLANPPAGSPVGTPQQFIVTTNGFTCVPQTNFVYNLANVVAVTNVFTNNTASFIQTISLAGQIGAPIGSSPVTNITMTPIILTNVPPGDFFIVPPGLCGYNINTNPYILNGPVTATTNVLTTATNANGFVFSESIVTFFTNHYYFAQPVTCIPAATGLYQGIGKVQYVEADYDSLLGQFFQPVTNYYTMTLVTNSQAVVQKFQRVVTTPDFIFDADDLVTGPAAVPIIGTFARNLNFNTTQVLPGLAGPGTITPSTTITFDKVGPVYYNSFGDGLDGLDGTPYFNESPGGDISDLFYSGYFIWASYDGTTNAPVVYPDGTSVANLENQVLIQLSPAILPGGFSGVPYGPVTISAAGGAFTQPYTWSASGLPSGLAIASKPDSTATLSGTPAQSGTNDFILTLTDYVGRSVQWGYTIKIQ